MNANREQLQSTGALRASLLEFARAAWHPPTPFARALVAVLTIKLIAVLAMAVFFATQTVVVDAAAIGRMLAP